MPIERISQGGCFEWQIEATQTIWEGADLINDFQHQIAKLSSHHLQQNNPRMVGIVKLSEFDQKLGKTRIHNSLIVQHSGS